MNTLASRTILFLGVLSGGTSPAQVTWTQATTTVAPSARVKHRMVYDSLRDRVVLFGGSGTNETWEWDGTAWSQRFPAVSPPPREEHGMAYDSWRRRVVVFGGQGPLGDTWEYDGSTWQQKTPAASPAPRWAHAMTFDSVRGVVVMHGGANNGGIPETWEYDGITWAQRFPANNPRREEHAIAFDSHRGRVVLFGGRDGGTPSTDTLEWDGIDWTLRPTTSNPPPRAHYAVAYDSLRRRTVLFGGYPLGGGNLLGDTWEWDGTSWLQRAPLSAPPVRQEHAMAFDPARGEVLLFGGGLADTWRYAPTNPASYTALGTGCAGTAGTPALAPMAGHLPWLGDNVTMQVRNLPPTAPVVYLIGDSSTAWGTLPLPFDLTPIGMNACVLRAAGQVAFPIVNQAGTASTTLAIPNLRFLMRAPLYDQAFVLDPQANPHGATLSNAGQWRFGDR